MFEIVNCLYYYHFVNVYPLLYYNLIKHVVSQPLLRTFQLELMYLLIYKRRQRKNYTLYGFGLIKKIKNNMFNVLK